jgi:hypothetical protein
MDHDPAGTASGKSAHGTDSAASGGAGRASSASRAPKGHGWYPAVIALAVCVIALGAFAFGAWYHSRQFVCVVSPAGTVVCGRGSGPAGAAADGGPLVRAQGLNYREGRQKVTETRCRSDEDGVQICRTTEFFE